MIVAFFTFALVLVAKIARADISDRDYASMPDVFHLDNFDQCLSDKENGLYCMVTIQLSPSDPSNPPDVWKIIQEVSKSPFNYRHDRLRHGVCVQRSCPNVDTKGGVEELKEGLSLCFSQKLKNESLMGEVDEIRCETSESPYKIDWVDVGVAIVFVSYLLFVVVASCYESISGCGSKDESTKRKFLAAFSVPKNWRRLMTISESPDQKSLKCIQGLRFFNMVLIIASHTSMTLLAEPLANTDYTEKLFKKTENMLMSNGASSVQTFFLITGFLTSYQFFAAFEKTQSVGFGHLIKSYVARYVRLVPTVALILALHSTWLVHAGRGPTWDRIVGVERRNCRKNWWSNLLFIHNYRDPEHMCMQHTWYLGADMQVFAVCLVVVWLMFHHRKHVSKIVGLTIAIGAVLHWISHYLNDGPIVMMRFPEDLLYYMIHYKPWYSTYIVGHANIHGYTIGALFGYIFYKNRGRKLIANNRFYICFWWFYTILAQVLIILSGIVFFDEGFSCPQYLASTYDVGVKMGFALAIALLIYGITEGIGWVARDVLEWPRVQILGRLSFNAYICHSFMMKYRTGILRSTTHASDLLTIYNTVGDLAMSYLLATFLSLIVELPVSALQKRSVTEGRQALGECDSKKAK